MGIDSLRDMYVADLQQGLSFERHLKLALARMESAARDSQLRQAFHSLLIDTRAQLSTLEAILTRLGAPADPRSDPGMAGLVDEVERTLRRVIAGPLRDAALAASARRIQHYQIAFYGTLATYARLLGRKGDYRILCRIVVEETDAEQVLADIARELLSQNSIGASAA